MNKLTKRVLILIASIFFVSTAPATWPQSMTGSISGTVTDPSGAVVPDVTVVATAQSTNVKRSTVTDTKGFYSFPSLAVDKYDVSASHAGFRDYVEHGVTIDANSAVRVDVTMVVGAVTSNVEVQSAALQVETESTQMGEVIAETQVVSMPLNGRSFIDLLALQPGVSPYQNASKTGGAGMSESSLSGDLSDGTQSVNGGRTGANGFMVNGGDAQEGVHNGAALIPNLDSISEFRILTNNFDAQYGNYSGGQINVVTKAGTNRFHGDAFDFLRNTDLDAANYEAAGTRGVYQQNQFGGVVGGPIKRDRVFFFGDYQGTRQTIGATQNFNVPSLADRTGDLSDQAGNLTGSVVGSYWANILAQKLGYAVANSEPYYYSAGEQIPGQPDGTNYSADCSSSSYAPVNTANPGCVFPGAQIPITGANSVLDPVAKNILAVQPNGKTPAYIPAPNTILNQLPAYETNGFPETLTDNKYGIRGDINTGFGKFFVYFFSDKFNSVNPYEGASVPGFAQGNVGTTYMGDIGLTTTFGKATVNDVRVVYLRNAGTEGTILSGQGKGVTLDSLGFVTPWDSTPVGGIGNVDPNNIGVPEFGFSNFSFGTSTSIQTEINNTIQFLDNWTRIFGTHTFQAGGEFHYDQINQRHPSTPNGSFGFDGTETGVDFADFLIGALDSFDQQSFQILDTRLLYYGAYAQDSWRALPTLTINYGVRWEVSTPWYDATNKLEAFVPGEQSVVFPTSPQGQVEPLDPGIPRTLSPIEYHNFAPRIGIAWAPGGKIFGRPGTTSIRAGYGVFYQGIEDATSFFESGDAPYGQNWPAPVPELFDTPFVDRATGHFEGVKFPFVFPPKNVSPAHPFSDFNWAQVEPISGSEFFDIHSVTPYSQQLELSVQRQFGGSTVASVSYVGTIGNHLLTGWESNPGNPALCLFLSDPANLAPGSPLQCGPNQEENSFTEADGTVINTTRPFSYLDPRTKEFGFGTNADYSSIAHSMYNSLQVSLKNQSKYGNFLIGYTFAKAMDDGSDVFDSTYVFNPRKGWALSAFNVKQDLTASYTVNLPFSRLAGNGGVAQRVLGGWSLAGLTTYASGQPVQLSESDDRDLIGDGSFRFSTINHFSTDTGKLYNNKNPRKGLPYINSCTDPSLQSNACKNIPGQSAPFFEKDVIGQIGNEPRRFFPGPGIDNWNMSLLKTTKITEGKQLQFRFETFNTFNHAQFNNPSSRINSASSFGLVTSARDPRIMQAALKFLF